MILVSVNRSLNAKLSKPMAAEGLKQTLAGSYRHTLSERMDQQRAFTARSMGPVGKWTNKEAESNVTVTLSPFKVGKCSGMMLEDMRGLRDATRLPALMWPIAMPGMQGKEGLPRKTWPLLENLELKFL